MTGEQQRSENKTIRHCFVHAGPTSCGVRQTTTTTQRPSHLRSLLHSATHFESDWSDPDSWDVPCAATKLQEQLRLPDGPHSTQSVHELEMEDQDVGTAPRCSEQAHRN